MSNADARPAYADARLAAADAAARLAADTRLATASEVCVGVGDAVTTAAAVATQTRASYCEFVLRKAEDDYRTAITWSAMIADADARLGNARAAYAAAIIVREAAADAVRKAR